jgi:hypothetical protein
MSETVDDEIVNSTTSTSDSLDPKEQNIPMNNTISNSDVDSTPLDSSTIATIDSSLATTTIKDDNTSSLSTNATTTDIQINSATDVDEDLVQNDSITTPRLSMSIDAQPMDPEISIASPTDAAVENNTSSSSSLTELPNANTSNGVDGASTSPEFVYFSGTTRPHARRLADYFLVIGRSEEKNQPLVPLRRLSRSNSQTVQPISDLIVHTTEKNKTELPNDYNYVTDFSNSECNVNAGFMRSPIYLAECRLPRKNPAASKENKNEPMLLMPITAIDVIYVDKKETPKPGFTVLPNLLNKGVIGKNVAICIERDRKKSPIVDVKIISVSAGNGQSSPSKHTAHDEQCPPDYVMVKKSISTNKGRDLYICYKIAARRAVEYQAYEPFVLDRFPPFDLYDQPLEPQGVAMLCFPRGMVMQQRMTLPTFMTFVITQQDGTEMYGAALIFYEQISNYLEVTSATSTPSTSKAASKPGTPSNTSSSTATTESSTAATQRKRVVWCPKCLCLLSHHPHYDIFKTFLNQLYRIAVSPSDLPIERYIGNFFYDVPVPTPLFPQVRFKMGHAHLQMTAPQRLGLPYRHISLIPLFKCLSTANIVSVFEHLLREGKLVLVSSNTTLLTPIAEAIRIIMFPLRWQCVFIPVLPTNLSYTIRAPVPFIVGIHRSFLDEIRIPSDVMQVDLDRNRISQPVSPEDSTDSPLLPLPEPIRNRLLKELNSFVDFYVPVKDEHSNSELDSYTAPLEVTDEDHAHFHDLSIRITFMRVLIRFLSKYRQFCILRKTDEDDEGFDIDRLFDRKSFLTSFPSSLVDYARQFTNTQGFSDFIYNRVSPTSSMEEFLFFDWCCALTRESPLKTNRDDSKSTDKNKKDKKPLFKKDDAKTENGNEGYQLGSLSVEKVEELTMMPPAVVPFLYPPGQEKVYIAEGPDSSDCPSGLFNYKTFPKLDLTKFSQSARQQLSLQTAHAIAHAEAEAKAAAAKRAMKARQKELNASQSSPRNQSSPTKSPKEVNFSFESLPTPLRNNSGGRKFRFDSTVDAKEALDKIVLSLFPLLNGLKVLESRKSADDKLMKKHLASIYELWFALFVSECEKDRARRSATAPPLTVDDLLAKATTTATAKRANGEVLTITEQPAFSSVKLDSHVLSPDEELQAHRDLLAMYSHLHTMVLKGILPTECIMEEMALFCLRASLKDEFQQLYRLLSFSVPTPSSSFFSSLTRVGMSTLPYQPCSSEFLLRMMQEREKRMRETPELFNKFEYPLSMETLAKCTKCTYSLSGEEITAGWLATDRLTTTCPLCESAVQPSFIITKSNSETLKVDYVKATQLRSTIHAMCVLQKQVARAEADASETHSSGSTAVTDFGESGRVNLYDSSTIDPLTVTTHDYLNCIRDNPFLLWNCFWYWVSRGKHSNEIGQLPFEFLFKSEFSEDQPKSSLMLQFDSPTYRLECKPFHPWKIIQEIIEPETESISPPSSSPVLMSSDSSSSFLNTGGSNASDEESSLSLSADTLDTDTQVNSSTSATSTLSNIVSTNDTTSAPPTTLSPSPPPTTITPLNGAEKVKSWKDIVGMLHDKKDNHKPLGRAVIEILRIRKERKGWTAAEREADGNNDHFTNSMYRELALLMSPHSDLVTFANDYRSAHTSLESTIESHKKAIEVDTTGKNRTQLMTVLQEAIALRAEVLPFDAPPSDRLVRLITSVRRCYINQKGVVVPPPHKS